MKPFSIFITETKADKSRRLQITAWHASKKPFDMPFLESKIGSQNDEGFSGRGFYFFGSEKDTEFAVKNGYKRQFMINLKNALLLDTYDPFSMDIIKPYNMYRDEETLKLLKDGYDGAYRTLNGRVDEICVFSFKSKGFDGNNKIEPISNWIKI